MDDTSRYQELGRALARAIDRAWLETHDSSTFSEMVNAYRQIEEDFVHRPGSDDFHVLETKRRIAEAILSAANSHRQPFDTCRDAWNDLVRLGFTNFRTRCTESWWYADCCLFNEEPAAGLAVLEPLIIDIEQQLEGITRADPAWQRLQDELVRLKELWFDLMLVMKSLEAKSCNWEYAEVERQYREIETEFLARFQPDDESFMPNEKRRVQRTATSVLLLSAHELRPPFEVCRELWNELVRWSFEDLEDRCEMTWFYADCCLRHGQRELGLAVVEPLRAELQRQVDTGTNEDMTPEQYRDEITRFEKLRDELEALQSQNS